MSTWKASLRVKVPAVVLAFMAMVAFFVSERVLSRLAETQSRHLGDLATVYLDGLATALVAPVVREDVWEVFDILDRSRQTHAGLKPTLTVVATPDGRVLASSEPRVVSSRSALPPTFLTGGTAAPAVAIRDQDAQAVARRDLASGGQVVGSVHASFDITPLLAERRSVLVALIATNGALTLLLAAAAWLTVQRMMRPVSVLAAHLEAGAERTVEPIPPASVETAPGEFGRLFTAFNAMAQAVREREDLSRQLAEEERLASLGRLASGMAHEINNPLGGILNAVDTLKQHGARPEVRGRALNLIERGLKGIRDVVRTTLVTYRTDHGTPRSLQPEDLEDLRLLIGPEVRRKSLTVNWSNGRYGELPLPASAVRQILLNLLLNASSATPAGGAISLAAGVEAGSFVARVSDEGPGLGTDQQRFLEGAEELPPPSAGGAGLGLWMIRRLLKEVDGTIAIRPRDPTGTTICVAIPISREEALAHVA